MWYTIADTDELDTPALVVYPDRIKFNIDMVKSMIDDVDRLRPHVKTHKSPQVTKLMLQAGITKYKCATIAEGEMLAMCKAPDVLLAYQPSGPKLNRFIELIKKYPETTFSCVVDNVITAELIDSAARLNGLIVRVFIDLNVGMNRTGIVPGRDALALYVSCTKLPGIKVIGLHAYDGHIHDADIQVRMKKADDAMQAVYHLARLIEEAGLPLPVIIAGGSPTYPILAGNKRLECSPGTFAYWDRGYQMAFDEQPFLPAALIIARVISLPDTGKICIDVGHKSVSAENELAKRIYFLNAPDLVFTSQSEEHLVADAGENHTFKIGDILYGLPYHICPTIALYERALVIEEQHVKGEWLNTARDRKITI
ncbi:threonine aldolase [Mucilaginibacter sp. PAMC 26640]|nr:threonine aldolase [Mucilaginibacter sp. PAMC 26640]